MVDVLNGKKDVLRESFLLLPFAPIVFMRRSRMEREDREGTWWPSRGRNWRHRLLSKRTRAKDKEPTGEHLAKHATSFCRVTAKGSKQQQQEWWRKERGGRKGEEGEDAWPPGGKYALETCRTCWRSSRDTTLTRSGGPRIYSTKGLFRTYLRTLSFSPFSWIIILLYHSMPLIIPEIKLNIFGSLLLSTFRTVSSARFAFQRWRIRIFTLYLEWITVFLWNW